MRSTMCSNTIRCDTTQCDACSQRADHSQIHSFTCTSTYNSVQQPKSLPTCSERQKWLETSSNRCDMFNIDIIFGFTIVFYNIDTPGLLQTTAIYSDHILIAQREKYSGSMLMFVIHPETLFNTCTNHHKFNFVHNQ